MLTLALALTAAAATASAPRSDTLRLEVGSPGLSGLVYRPHKARVRVHLGSIETPPVAEWTNELTLGDSAGRPVMRWVTRGTRRAPSGQSTTWEILQTYDHVTLAPYGYASSSSLGSYIRLSIDGRRVRGSRKAPSDSIPTSVDTTVARMGFIASASDLVPLAAGLKEGRVVIAPVWGPNMPAAEYRVFTVAGRESIMVEGTRWSAWKVEERRQSDSKLLANWFLVDGSPYMVAGDVFLPDGQIQKMTEVAIP
jgi:hypothetical protein